MGEQIQLELELQFIYQVPRVFEIAINESF